MAIKSYKPTSPGRRFATTPAFDEITKTEPEKSLTVQIKRKGGRNNNGRITTASEYTSDSSPTKCFITLVPCTSWSNCLVMYSLLQILGLASILRNTSV